jgi:hypothetical protein
MSTSEPPVEPALLTLDEVCERLRISRSTLRRMIARRELLAFKLHDTPNAPLRILSSSLKVYLQQRIRASSNA